MKCLYQARKWAVMYLRVSGINFVSFYYFFISPLHQRRGILFYLCLSFRLFQDIFRRIFLSNYSDIWSQASYRYFISWEAFLDPSHSYFLFAEERGYHKWALQSFSPMSTIVKMCMSPVVSVKTDEKEYNFRCYFSHAPIYNYKQNHQQIAFLLYCLFFPVQFSSPKWLQLLCRQQTFTFLRVHVLQ